VNTYSDSILKEHMKTILIVWMIFGGKLLSSFLMLEIYSFTVRNLLFCLRYRQTSSGNIENLTTPVWIASARPNFRPFTLLWVLIHTLETTGLDQLTNRCVKLRRQVGLFHCRAVVIIDCGFVFANAQPFSHFA